MLTNVDKTTGFRGFHFFWWGMIAPSPSRCGTAGHVRGRTHRIRCAGGHIDPFVHALFTLRSEGIRKPLHCHPSDRRSTEVSASPGARRRLPRLFSSHSMHKIEDRTQHAPHAAPEHLASYADDIEAAVGVRHDGLAIQLDSYKAGTELFSSRRPGGYRGGDRLLREISRRRKSSGFRPRSRLVWSLLSSSKPGYQLFATVREATLINLVP